MARYSALLPISLAAVALAGGCLSVSGADIDKTGNEVRVIRLATVDKVNNNGQSYGPQAFVDALADVSGDGFKVEVDLQTYVSGTADDESELVEAMARGEVDGGWPSTRAFSAAGIEGLAVVEAPMTLTSYAVQRDLVTSPVADQLLERLDGSGVLGLALAVGPLRRPFAHGAPMLEAADWRGQRIRSFNSPVQDATIQALGAEPVHIGFAWHDFVVRGELDGLEFDVAQYFENGNTQAANVATNVVLWPKVSVLSVSQQFYDSLTPLEQSWVRQAAEQARQASVDATYDENTPAATLCGQGVRFSSASAEQLEGLRTAVQPVLDALAEDPLLADVQAIAARHPEPETLVLPENCWRARVRTGDPGPVPTTPTGLPDGTYRAEISIAELVASGFGEPARGHAGIYTLVVDDGSFRIDCTPVSPPGNIDCWYAQVLPAGWDYNPRVVGTVTGDETTAYFVHDPALEEELTDCNLAVKAVPSSCAPPYRSLVTFHLDGDTLTFTDQVANELNYGFAVKPWTRIG